MRNGSIKEASIYPDDFTAKPRTGNIPPNVRTPGEFLSLLFTDEILQKFVDNTNSFGLSTNSTYKLDDNNLVTIAEMKKYFAVILFMGVVQLPSRDMYWESSSFGSSFVRNCFSRRRFYAISMRTCCYH